MTPTLFPVFGSSNVLLFVLGILESPDDVHCFLHMSRGVGDGLIPLVSSPPEFL
jgi:hypothetical protein